MGFKIEAGQVSIANTVETNGYYQLLLQNIYENPVAVVYIQTRNGAQSVAPRLDLIENNRIHIFMEEPDNETHSAETISYLVMEEGEYTMPDGTAIKAGYHHTDNTHSSGTAYAGDQITFSTPFSGTPVVLSSILTYVQESYMHTIAYDIDTDGFKLQLDEGLTSTSTAGETIGWIAIDQNLSIDFTDTIFGESIRESDGTADGDSDTAHIYTYEQTYSTTPIVLAAINSSNDNDSAIARGSGTNSTTQHGIFATEDQVADAGERNHSDETFGILVISAAFDYEETATEEESLERPDYAVLITPVGKDVFAENPVYEIAITSNRKGFKEAMQEVITSDGSHSVTAGIPFAMRFSKKSSTEIYGQGRAEIDSDTFYHVSGTDFYRIFYNNSNG